MSHGHIRADLAKSHQVATDSSSSEVVSNWQQSTAQPLLHPHGEDQAKRHHSFTDGCQRLFNATKQELSNNC